MTDDLHNLDGKFKQSAEEFSLTPSERVWKGVEQEIRPSRNRLIFLGFLGGMLLCGNLIAWWVWTHQPQQQQIVTQQQREVQSVTPESRSTTSPERNPDQSEQNDVALNGRGLQSDPPTENSLNPLPASERNSLSDKQESPAIPENNRVRNNQSRTSDPAGEVDAPPVRSKANHNDNNKSGNDVAEVSPVPDTDAGYPPAKPESLHNDGSVINSGQEIAVTPSSETELTTERSTDTINGAVPMIVAASDTDDVKPVDTIPVVKADSASQIVRTLDREERWLPTIDSVPESSAGRFSIAFGTGVSYSATRFQEKGDYQFIADYRNSTERDLVAMNYHVDFGYMFKYTYVYTGLHVVKYRSEMPNRQVVYHYDSGTSTGPVPPPVVVSQDYYDINNDAYGKTTTKLTYLAIPIGMRWKAYTWKRYSLWGFWELNATRLVSAQGYIYDFSTQEYRKMQTTDVRLWYGTLACGVHVNYKLNDRFALGFSASAVSDRKFYKRENPVTHRVGRADAQVSFRYTF